MFFRDPKDFKNQKNGGIIAHLNIDEYFETEILIENPESNIDEYLKEFIC